MTPYAKWMAGGVAAAIAIALLAWTILANRPETRCLDFYQDQVGATLKLVSSERAATSTWITVAGGPDGIRSTAVCQFDSDGKVDPVGTDLAWITKLTDESIACLDRNSRLWNAGQMKYEGRTQDCGEEAISRRSRWLRIFNDGDMSATFGRR
jgi:hypothetical protein